MMKRGKDDEKIMGPMFPRLHVSDTEKGGPRGPPRNKMALYEQLSIPSQSFNPGVLPLNPSNSSSVVPRGSSRQGSSLERNTLFPHVPPPTPTLQAEKFHARQLEGASMNATIVPLEQRKKARKEDDFMVPVFNAGVVRRQSKIQNTVDGENLDTLSQTSSCRSIKLQNVSKDPNWSGSSVVNLRKEVREQGEERSKVSTRQRIDGPKASAFQDCEAQPASKFNRLHSNDDCSRAGVQTKDYGCVDCVESVRDIDNDRVLGRQRSESLPIEDHSSPNETNNERRRVEICGALDLVNGNKSDDASEASMVDSISGVDISPDDVVGVIGQKHFWKARRAIVNRERTILIVQGKPETADHLVSHFLLICYFDLFLSRFDTANPCDPKKFPFKHLRAWSWRRTSGGGLSLELILGGSQRRET